MRTSRTIAALSFIFAAIWMQPGTARAQSRLGAFAPFDSWWVDPVQGTLGISFDSQALHIDTDGNGSTETSFLRPSGPGGIPDAAITSLRLTPSRTIVYAFGGACNGAGTLVYFYRVPAFGNRLDPILTGLCIPRGIDRVGFYDTGLCDEPNGPGLGTECTGHLGVSPQRIAYFATPSASFGFENFVWVDLVNGQASTASAFDFAKDLGFVHVSPSGTQAFVQHDEPVPGETDYRLIDLCPGSLGVVINAGGFPLLDRSDQLHAEVTAVAVGNVTIAISPPAGPSVTSFDLSDCLSAHGACCFESGCVADYTEELCVSSGTFLGAGSTCDACPTPPVLEACCFETGDPLCARLTSAQCTSQGGTPHAGVSFCSFDTCPTPNPQLAISGPASAAIGDTITYTLDYTNTGVTATAAQIEISLPYGTTFVSATGGGDLDGSTVRWELGDLAPGTNGSVSFVVTAACLAAGNNALVQGLISYAPPPDGGRTYYSSNSIQTDFGSASSGPLSVSLASTPDHDPLLPGDEIQHAITLTNANADTITGVQIGHADASTPMGLYFGDAVSFSRVIDAAGGNVDTSSGVFEWTGDVPAGASRTIRFATIVDSCVPAGTDETLFDFGIAVAAFDQCNANIGASADPVAIALAHLVDVSVAATNLAPPQRLRAPIVDADVQIARPGTSADVALTVAATGQPVANASFSAVLQNFNVTAPPTEPGTSYDASTHVVSWSGSLAAAGSSTIHFSGTPTACRGEIDLSGSTGSGCTDIRATSLIAVVPQPPAGPWLAALAQHDEPGIPGVEEDLLRIDPGPPVQTTTMLCLPSEFATGIGAGPDGDVWVGWLPTYRVNPRTLDFQAFDADRFSGVGLSSLDDIAIDPTGGTVYFSGNDSSGFNNESRIVRYDPATDTLEPFLADSSYASIGSLVVDEQGSIGALAAVGGENLLVRVDPGAPPEATLLYDPQPSTLIDVALDRSGAYAVLEGTYGTTPVVYDVDRDTGDRTAIVPDLHALFPTAMLWHALEVGAGGDLFVAPAQPGLGRIQRATPDVGETLLPITLGGIGGITDLAIVSLSTPEPDASALALAAVAALLTLRGGRRQCFGAARARRAFLAARGASERTSAHTSPR